jgi:hypothetical protein
LRIPGALVFMQVRGYFRSDPYAVCHLELLGQVEYCITRFTNIPTTGSQYRFPRPRPLFCKRRLRNSPGALAPRRRPKSTVDVVRHRFALGLRRLPALWRRTLAHSNFGSFHPLTAQRPLGDAGRVSSTTASDGKSSSANDHCDAECSPEAGTRTRWVRFDPWFCVALISIGHPRSPTLGVGCAPSFSDDSPFRILSPGAHSARLHRRWTRGS